MPPSNVQPSLPAPNVLGIQDFGIFNRQAAENADPHNWEWSHSSVWELADEKWQEFKARWCGVGADQCASLLEPNSPFLSLEPLRDSSIIVRNSYTKLFDLVWERGMRPPGAKGVIITGQPGIGKTLFQYYLLVRLLQQKQVVLFSLDGKWLYLFYHDKVYRLHTVSFNTTPPDLLLPKPRHASSSKVFIWSLFDIEERNEPESLLVCRPCLPVQTTSTDPCRYRKWEEIFDPLTTGFPLWTRDELARGLPYQEKYYLFLEALREYYGAPSPFKDPLGAFPGVRALLKEREGNTVPEDALDYLLDTAIDRFGYSPRDVLGAVFDPAKVTKRHEDAFGTLNPKKLEDAASALVYHQSIDHTISHMILALYPGEVEGLMSPDWVVKFKSNWVARNVIKKLDITERDVIRKQVHFFQRIPGAKSMAEWFLEPLAYRATSGGASWPLIKMASNNADPPRFMVLELSSHVRDVVRFSRVRRKVVKFQSIPGLLESREYYVPEAPDFPLIDGFAVDFDYSKKSAILWVLQITTSRSDGGSKVGYQKVREIVATLKDQLRKNSPGTRARRRDVIRQPASESNPHVQIRYLLVVPKGNSHNLVWDFPEGWNENFDKNDHRGNVYCLELPFLLMLSSDDSDTPD